VIGKGQQSTFASMYCFGNIKIGKHEASDQSLQALGGRQNVKCWQVLTYQHLAQILGTSIVLLIQAIPHDVCIGRHPMFQFLTWHLKVLSRLVHDLVYCTVICNKLNLFP
jgi:hypothetical protein